MGDPERKKHPKKTVSENSNVPSLVAPRARRPPRGGRDVRLILRHLHAREVAGHAPIEGTLLPSHSIALQYHNRPSLEDRIRGCGANATWLLGTFSHLPLPFPRTNNHLAIAFTPGFQLCTSSSCARSGILTGKNVRRPTAPPTARRAGIGPRLLRAGRQVGGWGWFNSGHLGYFFSRPGTSREDQRRRARGNQTGGDSIAPPPEEKAAGR